MYIFSYIYYQVLNLIFELRRRLPLYANDHARINTAYALALLKHFQSPHVTLRRKQRLFEKYALRFSMPISVKRMAQTLYCDPRRAEFLGYLSKAKTQTAAERLRNRVSQALGRMPKQAFQQPMSLTQKLSQPKIPYFATKYTSLTYHAGKTQAERFSISDIVSIKPLGQKSSAILCLPLGRLVRADLEALKGFKNIIVLPQMPCDPDVISAGLKSALGSDVCVKFYDPKDHHAAPYSKGDSFVSGACDRLGADFMAQALKAPSVRRFIPKILDEDLALDISDIIYRPIQRFYAALRSVETQSEILGDNIPVFFSGPSNALPRTLALIGKNPVYILAQGSGVVSDEDSQDAWLLAPTAAEMTKGLNNVIRGLKKRLEAALPKIYKYDQPHIYVATNTRSKSYELANSLIKQEFTNVAPVSVFDFAAPQGVRNISKASVTPCLYNALHSADSGERALLSHFIQAGSRLTLDDQMLGPFPVTEMKEIVSIAIEQNIGALIGNVILYRMMVQKLDGVSNAQLLLVPGRHGNIRCLARAFETAGLPSLDVQVLFVSEMARYKPPMATRHTVIDSYTRDHYVNEWHKDPAKIELIGAINLDEDIKTAKGYNKAAQRKALLGNISGRVITFACQPLPETEIIRAIETIVKAVSVQDDLHLCVKLHPSQSDHLLAYISEYLTGRFNDKSRFSVLRQSPFSKIIAVTDILVSYFSNVCLMAPAFKIPVITLPSSTPMPSLTLADMGLAISTKSLDEFPSVLKTVLAGGDTKTSNLPPQSYIEKNPHMMTPDSLKRLARIVIDGFN